MSTISKVDPSTLGWVKAEIDETLKQARVALETYSENTADDTSLRHCLTYLHQVTGTLQMVELDGAAMLARECEAYGEALLAGGAAATPENIDILIRGLLTLPDYLARLQFGQPDAPIRLLPLLNELRTAHGEKALEPGDLFQPDVSVRPPGRPAGRQRPAENEFTEFARAQRPAFQVALLAWLRDTNNPAKLDVLDSLVAQLEEQAPVATFETLFWVIGGYIEALREGLLEPTPERKKVFARLEQLLKRMGEGSDKAAQRNLAETLIRSTLYEVAQAPARSGRVIELRKAFELDELMPAPEADSGALPTPEALQSVADAMGKEIEIAQDLLGTYFDPSQANQDLSPLLDVLRRMAGILDMLGVEPLKLLTDELIRASEMLIEGTLADPDHASLPMAGALLIIEQSTRDVRSLGSAWKKQVDDALAALRRLTGGDSDGLSGIELSESELTDSEFKQLVAVVGSEIRVNLAKVEESLEAFAASPENGAALEPAGALLSQIQGALQILGQEKASELTALTSQHLQWAQNGEMGVDNRVLDAFAVAVGTIGAYIEGLEHDRPNLDLLLRNARNDLASAAAGHRPVSGDPVALVAEFEASLNRWFADPNDRLSLMLASQPLHDIVRLADRQQAERPGKIAGDLIQLLSLVAEDPSQYSAEVEAALQHSSAALPDIAARELRSESIATPRVVKAAPKPAPAPAPAASAGGEVDEDEEIMQIFIEDARDMIALISRMLPAWERNTDDRDSLLEMRRGFHTLKGSGRMVGASEISELAWAVENMLNKVREGKIAHSPEMFQLLHRVHDVLPAMVAQLEGAAPVEADIAGLRAIADAMASGQPADLGALYAADPSAGASMAEEVIEAMPAVAITASGQPLPRLDETLLGIFTGEARTHLKTVEDFLAENRASHHARLVTHEMIRAVHTLRGSSRSLGMEFMAAANEHLENILHALDSHHQPFNERLNTVGERLASAMARTLDALAAQQDLDADTHAEFMAVTAALAEESGRLSPEGAAAKPARPQAAKPVVAPPVVTQQAAAPSPAQAPAPARAPAARGPVVAETLNENLDPELLEIFLEEAVDILAAIEESLVRWRAKPADRQAVAELKRSLHTLKGGARMAGAMTMGNLGHHTESLLKEIEDGKVVADKSILDLLDEVHDAVAHMVQQMQQHQPVTGVTELMNRVLALLGQAPMPVTAAPPTSEPAIATQAEPEAVMTAAPVTEAPSFVPAAHEPVAHAAPAGEVHDPLDRRGEEAAEVPGADRRGVVRVQTGLLDKLANFAGEVSISRSRMEQQIFGVRENLKELSRNVTRFRDQIRELEIQSESQIIARAQETSASGSDFDPLEFDRFSQLQTLSRSLAESLHDLFTIQSSLDNFAGQAEAVLTHQARLNTDLQEGLMSTRMIAFGTQSARLRHIVRQTAREVGKRVEFDLEGGDVEIDRNVLDRMVGPFEHMLRNSIDHGIESAAARKQAGKPETGRITISATNEGNEIVIRISDDGAGLNVDAIRRKAIERGMLKPDVTLADDELIQFILMPGFSTAEKVTQLSGRGVGMDVVHNEVRQLGGSITVDTRRGQGTTFLIRLPLSLSLTQALMVFAGEMPYAVPLSSVANILEVPFESLVILSVGKNPLLQHEGQVYPFINLADRLNVPPLPRTARKAPVLLARVGGRLVAIQVDGLSGTREVVIKPLNTQLAEIGGLAGATILGDGRVVLILDLAGLWMSEEGLAITHAGAPQARATPVTARPVEAVEVEEEITLSAIDEAPAAPAPQVQRDPVIMVVDDSITVRKVTAKHLQKRNMEVLTAKDGLDAVEQLRDRIPDVMLVDIEMPRMDGYELTTHVRNDSTLKHVPIIMITSRAGDKHRDRAYQLGVNTYMTKPYQEDELMKNIVALLPAHLKPN